jgi:hypothetical protein
MFTISRVAWLWKRKQYEHIVNLCMDLRHEPLLRLQAACRDVAVAAAAAAVIRMEELCLSHAPLCGQLLRFIISQQQADGGWGNPALTELCIRALKCEQGQGLVIDRGIGYLAGVRKNNWAEEAPLPRMQAVG